MVRVSKWSFTWLTLIGLPGCASEGSYQGRLSTTPSRTDCATIFPISSPSSGTSLLSEFSLYSCGQNILYEFVDQIRLRLGNVVSSERTLYLFTIFRS